MFSQQPKTVNPCVTFGPMTGRANTHLPLFAERLRELCADMGLQTRGRQTQLAKRFGVSQQAARKWLEGLSYPELDTVIDICEWSQVSVNWLLQGLGPKKGDQVAVKALVLDEALRSLPSALAVDLVDNLRAKLERVGRLTAREPIKRYLTMLDSYEHEIGPQKH